MESQDELILRSLVNFAEILLSMYEHSHSKGNHHSTWRSGESSEAAQRRASPVHLKDGVVHYGKRWMVHRASSQEVIWEAGVVWSLG